MSDEKAEKKGVLRFEEGMKQFICWSKKDGLTHLQEIAVDIYLDEEDIGYITKDGKITIDRTIIDREPSRLSRCATTLTLKQWTEIGVKAKEFKEKSEIQKQPPSGADGKCSLNLDTYDRPCAKE